MTQMFGIDVTVDENVMTPMRDGVRLECDVYRPAGPGPFPAILTRSPYGRGPGGRPNTGADFWVRLGYAFVTQDCRGRFGSEGEYTPHLTEGPDGYDTVEWIAEQSWCDGNVGIVGQSYLGADQYQLAPHSPPHLKAMAPVSGTADHRQSWTRHAGGALEHGWMVPYSLLKGRNTLERKGLTGEQMETLESYLDPPHEHGFFAQPLTPEGYAHVPLTDWIPLMEDSAPYFKDYLNNPDDGPFWWEINVRRGFHTVDVPMLHFGSWYDIFLEGTLSGYEGINALGGPNARGNQRLLVGPWGHIGYSLPTSDGCGDLDFGPEAEIDFMEMQKRWFGHWLKGEDTGIMDEAPVRIFVMGENRWRDEQEWPLARTEYTPWYLHSGGSANSLNGDGALSPESPAIEPPDRYVYDPNDPVPSLGGNNLIIPRGAFDQRPAEVRDDVLVYTGEVLSEDLEVTGPLRVTLWATSSAVDTDFTAKLVDVYPDGYAQNLQDGMIRARYRDSASDPKLLTPGQAYRYEIDLWATSHVFLAGHSIRIEISSSCFPRFDRNPNTGTPVESESNLVPAAQMVLHDAQHPSYITLPVIPR